MTFIFEGEPRFPIEYAAARYELPFSRPGGESPHDAMMRPGNCVKSKEREPSGFPKHHARVVSVGDDGVWLIVNEPACGPRFVWKGSVKEYLATWECD